MSTLAHFEFHGRVFKYSRNSLFIFTDKNLIRKVLVWLSEWQYATINSFYKYFYSWFKTLISLSILTNSICQGLYDYSDRNSLLRHNQILDTINESFTYVFLFEAAIKIVAMGFALGPYSYMRDSWNVMDVSIATIG
jgi:voltage-dependent calcium channel P/Q type alpha-1A